MLKKILAVGFLLIVVLLLIFKGKIIESKEDLPVNLESITFIDNLDDNGVFCINGTEFNSLNFRNPVFYTSGNVCSSDKEYKHLTPRHYNVYETCFNEKSYLIIRKKVNLKHDILIQNLKNGQEIKCKGS